MTISHAHKEGRTLDREVVRDHMYAGVHLLKKNFQKKRLETKMAMTHFR